MQKRRTNYEIYEQINLFIKQNKPWSNELLTLIKELESEPDYPIDDPLIIELIIYSLNEIRNLDSDTTKRVKIIDHILEINFQTFDSFHYDLLATYLYDLSDHLKGLQEPHPPKDELKKAKTKSIAKLIESLAAICANNAQLLSG